MRGKNKYIFFDAFLLSLSLSPLPLCSPLTHLFPLVLVSKSTFSLCSLQPLSALSFLFPVFHFSFCLLLCSHPTLTQFSHFLQLPFLFNPRCLFSAPLSNLQSSCSSSPLQKRKTTTISVEVKKSQHKYIIGPKGNTLQEILEATGVSVEMPPLDSGSETIILRGEPDKLGPALTQVYAKVRMMEKNRDSKTLFFTL